jgi:aryl-alcohol dehydrogenase-like predicted oxidoreductase
MNPSCHHLALGTAQLGMPYGIANSIGQPESITARQMVTAAWEHGVRFFDTAQSYGISERVLGQALRSGGLSDLACVITKLSPTISEAGADQILAAIRDSLERLGIPQLWAILLHREEQLDQWNGPRGVALRQACEDGMTQHLGVSVYTPHRALQALEMPGIDVLQVPANLFDRRMQRSQIFQKAAAKGVTVFIRSIYLQGLALFSSKQARETAPFALSAVTALERFCKANGLDQKRFAFEYAKDIAAEAFRIVGAETPEQVVENARLEKEAKLDSGIFREWDKLWPNDENFLVNPCYWPETASSKQ